MAFSKIELFDTKLQQCAELYKALAHPARLAIMKYLAESKTCITGDFADELPLSRTTVNQHLAELRNAELIVSHTEGTKTFYCLNQKKIKELNKISESFLKGITIKNKYNCK